jgi:hypothetical protein
MQSAPSSQQSVKRKPTSKAFYRTRSPGRKAEPYAHVPARAVSALDDWPNLRQSGITWDTMGSPGRGEAQRSGDPVIGESGDRKSKTSPLMNTDDTDQESEAGNQLDFGQQEEERCAVSDGAFHPDGTAMVENNMLYDCQTEACAAAFARARFVDAIKALEDSRQMLRSDAGAEVADKELNAVFALFCADNDFFSALGVEFQRVPRNDFNRIYVAH